MTVAKLPAFTPAELAAFDAQWRREFGIPAAEKREPRRLGMAQWGRLRTPKGEWQVVAKFAGKPFTRRQRQLASRFNDYAVAQNYADAARRYITQFHDPSRVTVAVEYVGHGEKPFSPSDRKVAK